MAALPSNNTDCLFVDYSTCSVEHTVQVRFSNDGDPVDAMVGLHDLLTALDPGLTLLTVLRARVRLAATTVSFEVPWTGDPTYGGTLGPRYKGAAYLDFVGRDTTGRRNRVAIFGPGDFFDTANEDYRFTADDSAVIAAALVQLNLSEGSFLTIAGNQPIWNTYANTGVNAYWRNKIR